MTTTPCPIGWRDAAGTRHHCTRWDAAHVKPHRCGCGSERSLDATGLDDDSDARFRNVFPPGS